MLLESAATHIPSTVVCRYRHSIHIQTIAFALVFRWYADSGPGAFDIVFMCCGACVHACVCACDVIYFDLRALDRAERLLVVAVVNCIRVCTLASCSILPQAARIRLRGVNLIYVCWLSMIPAFTCFWFRAVGTYPRCRFRCCLRKLVFM